MGFFKRIFSISSKKSKKVHSINKRRSDNALGITVEQPERPAAAISDSVDQEEAVTRLLRSASSRYAVVKEVDHNGLAPLPHPINQVIQTPAAPTPSLVPTASRGTYNVTVLHRTQHSLTEAASTCTAAGGSASRPRHDTEPSSSSTPAKPSRRARLLDSTIFSNTPPSPEKHKQARKEPTGSTLRQLLGSPNPDDVGDEDDFEGDISWAERYLDDMLSSTTTISTVDLDIPTDVSYLHDIPIHVHDDTALHDRHDSLNVSSNYPGISSVEVETSGNQHSPTSNYYTQHDTNPETPQRASEVFAFLTQKSEKRPSPSSYNPPMKSRFSPDSTTSSADSSFVSNISVLNDTFASSPPRVAHLSTRSRPRSQSNHLTSSIVSPTFFLDEEFTRATSRGQSQSASATEDLHHLRPIPNNTDRASRGPRPLSTPLPLKLSRNPSDSRSEERSPFRDSNRDKPLPSPSTRSTAIPSGCEPSDTRPAHQRRLGSVAIKEPVIKRDVCPAAEGDKENASVFDFIIKRSKSVRQDLLTPAPQPQTTPLQPHSRSINKPLAEVAPSPASSSELSPVGRQIMTSLRKRRMRAKENERKNGRGSRRGKGSLI